MTFREEKGMNFKQRNEVWAYGDQGSYKSITTLSLSATLTHDSLL